MNNHNHNRVAAGVPAGGQFASSTRAEADVALSETSSTAKWNRLADTIRASGHTGELAEDGRDSCVWTEGGAGYRLTWLDHVAVVESLDTDAVEETTSFSFTGDHLDETAVAAALERCRRHRSDILASNTVFADVSTGIVSRDYDTGQVRVELTDGVVTLGPYNSGLDDWADHPYLNIAVDEQAYRVRRTDPEDPTSRLDVLRDEDDEPLKRWEAQGVLARAEQASGRSLGDVFRSVESNRSAAA